MKSINDGPGQKQDQNKNQIGGKTAGNENSEKNKGKEATGPNWDKKSKGAEGDSGQNAGVFK